MAESSVNPAYVFALYTWISYCLMVKQNERLDQSKVPISSFIYYPMQLTCLSLLVDNLRLFIAAKFGKDGASRILAQAWYFLHMMASPISLAPLMSLWGILTGLPWMRFLGGSFAVFFGMNAINVYVSTVHGTLEYSEENGIPQYKKKPIKKRKGKDDGVPALMLPHHVIVASHGIITIFILGAIREVMPFGLLALSVIGENLALNNKGYKPIFMNFSRLLSAASLISAQKTLSPYMF